MYMYIYVYIYLYVYIYIDDYMFVSDDGSFIRKMLTV